ncbi:aminoacyl-histidine dipeptidase [Fulvitalea axinellae]|uniref:Cytosol non-specific dipeptidase n=1 Tax=Fulvitalea axinellae TaxID=1182444 RepID=A0AAU9D847_9BACT|nr:aminoacyl-histidine dipeptidase [Fulvitalea axinellae]
MNQEIIKVNPQSLWTNFEKLNEIPRASKKEERVVEFVKNFGESLGLDTYVDKVGNIVIRKPATPGMEDRQAVVLQAHVDMVHQKNADTDFDFDTEGIRSYIDGDWLKAEGTTLGSDNGIGVAAAMSVLEATDIEHGPLEALFTIDEETGMTGAFALEAGVLQADILLNMDTEEEGELTIGCAGGIDTNLTGTYQTEATPAGAVAYKIVVNGLKGGHSGGEIHLGRGNANKIMNRLLYGASSFGLRVAEVDGGGLRNAIPRESFAVVTVEADKADAFEAYIKEMAETVAEELKARETSLNIEAVKTNVLAEVMATTDQKALLNAVYACPNGVLRMSDEIEGLVETSTNLARVLVRGGKIESQSLTRSSVESGKADAANAVRAAFETAGYDVEQTGDYPGWKPKPEAAIVGVLTERFKANFPGQEPVVNAVHAGLECGIIGRNYPEMDMISFGPTIHNPHSPDEMVEIPTVERFWNYLIDILKNIPKK